MDFRKFSRQMARRCLNRLGVDVRLLRNIESSEESKWRQRQDALWLPFLRHRDIKTVVDVGANAGQFATLVNRLCPTSRIVSFEPIESCHAELADVLGRIKGSKIVKAAVGDHLGTAKMNLSEFSPCSSFLRGTELLGEDYAGAAVTQVVEVPVVTIDQALADEDLESEVLLKLDVQGFEIPAIRGAASVLKRTSIIVCEVSFFRRLYEGQPIFHEVYQELRQHGFTYMGNAEQHARKADGRIVEADAIFERLESA